MRRRVALLFVSTVCVAVWSSAAADATADGSVVTARFSNGISARVYTAEYLAARTLAGSTRGTLSIEGEEVQLITDINDPLIVNKGDGRFHPVSTSLVLDCLDRIEYPGLGVEVDVYVLPYPRVEMISSSAVGRRIFLSPHVLEVSPEGASYIVAHEMGHVFQYSRMPAGSESRWEEYGRVRGILGDPRFSDAAPHAYRPREIFAEDFRVLFGGPLAFFGGRVENPELPSPLAVAGVEEFFLGLTKGVPVESVIASVTSYPNPFNPQTELRVELGSEFQSAGAVTVRVYDVRGALVRHLYAGQPAGSDLRVVWDGRDGEGRQAASSTYFAVVEAGGARMTTKLLMIK